MRTSIILMCLFVSITSCVDSKKDENTGGETDQMETLEKVDKSDSYNNQKSEEKNATPETADQENSKDQPEVSNSNPAISGIYLKTDHSEDTACKCYCIDIKTSGTSELCLKEDVLYINALYKKNGNNFDVYYAGKTASSDNQDIPWDKFDTGTPIAVLSPGTNGTMKLDWKGFSIDGKIAVDYALYGKKTLEGTYKKK